MTESPTKQADDLTGVQWPLMGYAPGGYMRTCQDCTTTMIGCDKRATQCLSCAITTAKALAAAATAHPNRRKKKPRPRKRTRSQIVGVTSPEDWKRFDNVGTKL